MFYIKGDYANQRLGFENYFFRTFFTWLNAYEYFAFNIVKSSSLFASAGSERRKISFCIAVRLLKFTGSLKKPCFSSIFTHSSNSAVAGCFSFTPVLISSNFFITAFRFALMRSATSFSCFSSALYNSCKCG